MLPQVFFSKKKKKITTTPTQTNMLTEQKFIIIRILTTSNGQLHKIPGLLLRLPLNIKGYVFLYYTI